MIWISTQVLRRLFPVRYVHSFGQNETEFWQIAAKHVPFGFRWLGRTISVEQLDRELAGSADWENLKSRLKPSDRLCPFAINRDTLSMRQGYVAMRGGTVIGGVVTAMS